MAKHTVGQPDIDAQVLRDGSAISADAEKAEPARELVDMALGFLTEGDHHLEFTWTGDDSGTYWLVRVAEDSYRLERSARVQAWAVENLPYGISSRELDVLSLVAAGMSNGAIAEALVISPRTVTTHVDHVMRKLDASTRTALAARALDEGVIAYPFPAAADAFDGMRIGRVARSAGIRPTAAEPVVTRQSAPPILIGALVPLGGRAESDGLEMLNGAILAIEEINLRGGVLGRKIEMVWENADVDERASVEAAAERLLAKRVDVITSGYFAYQTAAIEKASRDGVPYMHSSASVAVDAMVSSDPVRYRNVFQFCPNDTDYAPNFVRFMTGLRESGHWRPASNRLVIAQQSAWEIVDFGIDVARVRAESAGWELLAIPIDDGRSRDGAWCHAALELARQSPAAVMVGSYFVSDHWQFIHQFRAERSPALLYSIYAPSIPEFRLKATDDAEGLLWATTTGTYSDRLGRDFATRYANRFGVAPGRSHAGISYDRVHILAQAWAQAGNTRDFDALAARIADIRYRGLNGAYSFDSPGHSTLALGSASNDPSMAQAHTIFQIQSGRNVLIDPHIYATGSFRSPPWAR